MFYIFKFSFRYLSNSIVKIIFINAGMTSKAICCCNAKDTRLLLYLSEINKDIILKVLSRHRFR